MKNKNYSRMVALFALVLAITTSLWFRLPATLYYAQGGYGGPVVVALRPPPAAITAAGTVNLTPFLDAEGTATTEINLSSTNGQVTVVIPQGTSIFDAQGNPVPNISIYVNELQTPPPPPGYTLVGPAYDCGPDGTMFVPAISLAFAYDPADIPTGVSEADLVMAYWDGDQWAILPTTVNTGADTATVSVAHFTPFAILAKLPLVPAGFKASSLNISPAEADIGQTVTIGVLVTNTGELAGSYTVTLKIDEVVVAIKEVTLDGGARQEVDFTTSKDVAGTYTVAVNGLVGEFAVKTLPPPAPPPAAPTPPISWWIIGVIIAEVVAIAVLLYLVRRSRLIAGRPHS